MRMRGVGEDGGPQTTLIWLGPCLKNRDGKKEDTTQDSESEQK